MDAELLREHQPWVRPEHAGGDDTANADVEPAPLEGATADDASAVEAFEPPEPREPVGGGGWTIPLICIGMALIACCVLIPAADENRRIRYESSKLQADLDQIKDQIQMNDEFLRRVAEDPSLSERLAQRQLKIIRQGTSILKLRGQGAAMSREMSPFDLVTLPPPPELPPYEPIGGALSALCRHPRSRLYGLGFGMIVVAAGLVLGQSRGD